MERNPAALPAILEDIKRARTVIDGGKGDLVEGRKSMADVIERLLSNGYNSGNTPKTFALIDAIVSQISHKD